MRNTHGDHLKRMIQYGIDTGEKVDAALFILGRIAPETMSQEQVAQRWPRILALMITESLGYFTPRSAANALLAHKLKRTFGCEYYCFAAGFESDGWPKEKAEYDRKLRETNENKIRYSVWCRRYRGNYDVCQACGEYRCRIVHGATGTMHVAALHEFVDKPFEHFGCRHIRQTRGSDYQYALKLVREMAGGAANPPSLLASWF
jgi:hypothetical protein